MTIGLLIIAIVIGYIRKGSLRNLSNLDIKLVPLVILSLAIQVGIYCGYAFQIEFIMTYDILLHFISYIVLLVGLMGNFSNKWFILLSIGVILNFMAIFLNGGKMPVSYDAASTIGLTNVELDSILAAKDGTHQPLHDGTLMWRLADIIPISLPGPFKFLSNIYSVGDLVILVGLVGLIQSTMVKYEYESDDLDAEELEETSSDIPVDALQDYDLIFQMNEIDSHHREGESEDITKEIQEDATIVIKPIDIDEGIIGDVEDKADDTQLGDEEKPDEADDIEEIIEVQEKELEQLDEIDDKKVINEIENESKSEAQIVDSESMEHETEELYFDPVVFNEEDTDQFVGTETEEEVVIDDFEVNKYEQYDDEQVDTVHQFIIEDGKIIENPNYLTKHEREAEGESDINTRVNKLEEQVEELEMTKVSLEPHFTDSELKEEKAEKNKLQKMTDDERIELMKRMKERKEEGYNLVEVKVGNKRINFWKKDL